MSKINVLNMDFEEDNCPDFGSMEMDKRNEDLHLLADDIPKLNEILTMPKIFRFIPVILRLLMMLRYASFIIRLPTVGMSWGV